MTQLKKDKGFSGFRAMGITVAEIDSVEACSARQFARRCGA